MPGDRGRRAELRVSHGWLEEMMRDLAIDVIRDLSYLYIPQTGTVGVLNSYYNGSMDKMIRGPDPRRPPATPVSTCFDPR